MKDLLEKIDDILEQYRYEKLNQIEVDDNTEFEIYKRIESVSKSIKEDLKDLDEDIDTLVEEMNEESDYDYDMREYDYMRSRELRGA